MAEKDMIFVTVVTLLQEKSGLPLLLPWNGLWGKFPGRKSGVRSHGKFSGEESVCIFRNP